MKHILSILLTLAGFSVKAQEKPIYIVIPIGYQVSYADTTYLDSVVKIESATSVKLFGYNDTGTTYIWNWGSATVKPILWDSFIGVEKIYTVTPRNK